jgi:hypothetical protein
LGNPDNPNIWHDGGDGGTNDMPRDGHLRRFTLLFKLGDALFKCGQAVLGTGW